MAPSNAELPQAVSALVQRQSLVSVFFGSTSTIGQATLKAIAGAAKDGGKGYRTYLVGRNATATDPVIDECKHLAPNAHFIFVKCSDLSLLTEVSKACEEIIKLEEETGSPRIDYLMLSQGGAIFIPRKDTKEGLDITMSLMYYSRMKAITQLLPLLMKSTYPATVVSVFAAGTEGKIYPEDLSLRDLSKYSYTQARSHMAYMHTLYFEALTKTHPLRMVHIFPGVVVGPGFWNPEVPYWIRFMLKWIFLPIFGRLICIPPEQCGRRMVSLMSSIYPRRSLSKSDSPDVTVGTSGQPGSGVYTLGPDGNNNFNPKLYEKFDKDEMRQLVWEHTNSAFETIEHGHVFTE